MKLDGRRRRRRVDGCGGGGALSAMSASPATSNVSVPVEPERRRRLAASELQRQHAHADEVRPVDALEALGEHGADAEQQRCPWPPSRATTPSRTPCPRARRAARRRPRSGWRRRRSSSARRSGRCRVHAALGAGRELVAQPDVGERAADHDLVVAAARAVGVEVAGCDAVLERATGPRGRRPRSTPAGEMWSVVTLSPSMREARARPRRRRAAPARGACRRRTGAGGCRSTSSSHA